MTTYTESDSGMNEVEAWGKDILAEAYANSQAYKILNEAGMVRKGKEENYDWNYYTALTGFAVRTNQYDEMASDALNVSSVAFATKDLRRSLGCPITFDALEVGETIGVTIDNVKKMLVEALTDDRDQLILRDGCGTDGDISASAIGTNGSYIIHGNRVGDTTSAIASGDTLEINDIIKLWKAVRTENCKPTHLFIHPIQAAHLLMGSPIRSAAEFGNNRALVTGEIPDILNMKVISTTNVKNFTSSGTDFGIDGYAGLMIDVNRAYGIWENVQLRLGLDTLERQTLYWVTASYKMDVEELDAKGSALLVSGAY